VSKYKSLGQTDQDIIRAIGYITDMRYIASYYGVDVQRVIHLRDKIKKPKEEVVVTEHALEANVKPRAYSTGLNSDSERKWNASAKKGSAALLKALLKFYEKRLLDKHIAHRDAEIERLHAALEAIEAEDGRVTQLQMAHLKQTLKEQSEIREAAKWSSQ